MNFLIYSMNSFNKKDVTSFSKQNTTAQKNYRQNDIYRLL